MSVSASGIGSVKNPQSVQSITHYSNIDSRKSIEENNPYIQQHHFQHQKSVDSISGVGMSSMAADVFNDDSTVNDGTQHSNIATTNNNQLSKLSNIVLNLPLPQSDSYQHERNQRSIILYGCGTKRYLTNLAHCLFNFNSLILLIDKIYKKKQSL